MKLKTGTLFWTFIWSWFMGITAISIGFGALFPSMNLISKPLVCPHGSMDLEKQVYHPYPGNTITTITWYCTDRSSGTRSEVGIFPMSLYAGTAYGWLLFGVIVIGMLLAGERKQRQPQVNFADTYYKSEVTENTLSRMKELKDLRAASLISESEYEEKRSQILNSL